MRELACAPSGATALLVARVAAMPCLAAICLVLVRQRLHALLRFSPSIMEGWRMDSKKVGMINVDKAWRATSHEKCSGHGDST